MKLSKKNQSPFPLKKIVEVEWEDACGRSGWEDLSAYEAMSPMPCKTCGYLVRKTTDKITVALTQAEEDSANGSISIPLAWVKKVRYLK